MCGLQVFMGQSELLESPLHSLAGDMDTSLSSSWIEVVGDFRVSLLGFFRVSYGSRIIF